MEILIYGGALRGGGGVTVLKNLVDSLSKNSHYKLVVYSGTPKLTDFLNQQFHNESNVEIEKFYCFGSSILRYLYSKLYFLILSIFTKKKLLISINFLLPSFDTKFVIHLNLLHYIKVPWRRSVLDKLRDFDAKLACRLANINVFESEFLLKKAEAASINIKNSHVIHAAIDPIFYNATQCNYKKGQLLLVSSMQEHKNNEFLLEVIKELKIKETTIDWNLMVVGGQCISQWDNFVARGVTLGLRSNIEIKGPVSKSNLSRLLNESMCLVSASKVESFCMVALEAMSSGTTAVLINSSSIPESVGDAAQLVSDGDVKGFTKCILKLLDNDFRESFIKKGNKQVKLFTQEESTRKLKELLVKEKI